jgi:hypothetical protein
MFGSRPLPYLIRLEMIAKDLSFFGSFINYGRKILFDVCQCGMFNKLLEVGRIVR